MAKIPRPDPSLAKLLFGLCLATNGLEEFYRAHRSDCDCRHCADDGLIAALNGISWLVSAARAELECLILPLPRSFMRAAERDVNIDVLIQAVLGKKCRAAVGLLPETSRN